MNRSKIVTLAFSCLVVFSLHVLAQEADSDDENIYNLSPFQVDEREDSGYIATSSLAGTRIKSELRDVGASIYVATKEFLQDTASNDAEDLLVYLAGTEVAGLGGNFGAGQQGGGGHSTESVNRNPSTPTRIRGLSNADLTREFFLTDIPFDSYNTSRVTVNRGPNAVLFGLGSPAGIIDNSLIKPTFSDHTNIEVQVSRFESVRGTFDVDRVLADGKLGIRIAGMYEDEKFQQDPAFQRNERLYGAFDFKIFENDESSTTLRGHFEVGESVSNRPRQSPPNDTLGTWWLNGQPTVDYRTDWRDQDRTVFSIPGGGWNQLHVVYNDPTATTPGGPGVPEAFTPLTNANFVTAPVNPELAAALVAGGRGTYLPSFRGVASYQDWAVGRSGFPGNIPLDEGGAFFVDRHLTDRTTFDFFNKLLDGPLKSEYYDMEAYNIALEQQLFNGQAGFEIAFDKQDFDNGHFSAFDGDDGYNIDIDPNSHFPNGDPNPNFGRPFVSRNPFASESEIERESFRLTAFAKIDLEEKLDNKLGRMLGRHTATGLFNSQTIDGTNLGFRGSAPSSSYLPTYKNTTNILDGGESQPRVLYYLGPSLANASSPSGANISNVRTNAHTPASANSLVWDTDAQDFIITPVSFLDYRNGDRLALASSASKTSVEVDSTAFIWQGHFWDNLLVGTAGWRKDQADSFSAPAPPRAADSHFLIEDPSFVLNSDPIGVAEKETWTYSGVLHVPKSISQILGEGTDLSLHYSESENFEPAAARFNAMGRPLASPTGITEDIGFTVSMFDRKLIARVSWFETSQTNLTNSQVPATSIIARDAEYHEANLRGVNDDNPSQVAAFTLAPQALLDFYGWEVLDGGDSDPSNDSVVIRPQGSIVGVTNRVTDGFEFELAYNPTPNWTMIFNAAQANAVQTGVDEGVQELLALRKPVWDAAPDLFDRLRNFQLSERTRDLFFKPWNVVLLSDGTPVSELREWRWNFITNYQFDADSTLGGFNIGGAGRWQDKAAIGLPVIFSDVLDTYALDPVNPIFGGSEFNADLWVGYKRRIWDDKIDWKLQLNLRNVIGEKGLIPIAAAPDGTIINSRIPRGTIWELSSRFSF